MTLELTHVQLECYLTSISQRSTNQIVPKFDIRELNLTSEQLLSYTMFTTLMTLAVPTSYCELAFTRKGLTI